MRKGVRAYLARKQIHRHIHMDGITGRDHIDTHTCTHMNTHAHTCTHTHIHARTHTSHTHTHTHTYVHIHIYTQLRRT